jgi:hypothetical protein
MNSDPVDSIAASQDGRIRAIDRSANEQVPDAQ